MCSSIRGGGRGWPGLPHQIRCERDTEAWQAGYGSDVGQIAPTIYPLTTPCPLRRYSQRSAQQNTRSSFTLGWCTTLYSYHYSCSTKNQNQKQPNIQCDSVQPISKQERPGTWIIVRMYVDIVLCLLWISQWLYLATWLYLAVPNSTWLYLGLFQITIEWFWTLKPKNGWIDLWMLVCHWMSPTLLC